MSSDFKFYVLNGNGIIVPPNDKGHVALKHEETFKLEFINPLLVRLQIDLYLNGKVGNEQAFIGTWILRPFQRAVLETYKDNGEQFTFVRKESHEFKETVAPFVSEDDYGRLSVWFRSEDGPQEGMKRVRSGVKACSLNSGYEEYGTLGGETTSRTSHNAGGIALSGSTNQTFGKTEPIKQYGNVNKIYDVRLVEKKVTSLYSNITPPNHIYNV